MKLTDFLQDVGRPVAFYPSLRRITGSTTATLFLCQLIYWKGKEADKEGWIYNGAILQRAKDRPRQPESRRID
jgi:hypothetical protein